MLRQWGFGGDPAINKCHNRDMWVKPQHSSSSSERPPSNPHKTSSQCTTLDQRVCMCLRAHRSVLGASNSMAVPQNSLCIWLRIWEKWFCGHRCVISTLAYRGQKHITPFVCTCWCVCAQHSDDFVSQRCFCCEHIRLHRSLTNSRSTLHATPIHQTQRVWALQTINWARAFIAQPVSFCKLKALSVISDVRVVSPV